MTMNDNLKYKIKNHEKHYPDCIPCLKHRGLYT